MHGEIHHINCLHCLVAARMTRCNRSTRFSEIDGERSVNRGVTLEAPNSWGKKMVVQQLQEQEG